MENLASQVNLNAPMTDDYLLQKKFEILIDLNNKKLATEIAAMKAMIDKLSCEVSDLRRNLHDRPQQRSDPSIVIETKHQESSVNTCSPVSRKEDAPKPRFGDYEPKDVSIDKFFYFGKGR